MNNSIRRKLADKLKQRYDITDDKTILYTFCPYRVCPVGAHIDHQKGNVTGFAINYGITIAFVPSHNHFFEALSLNFDGAKGDNITDIGPKKKDWADYIRGAAKILNDHYEINQGIYCVIDGSLPIGGISSSAAVIIAFMKALCIVNGLHLAKDEVVKLVQEVENTYVGVNSGTLDQSCELFSKKDHLLYLDTSTAKYKLIPKNKNMKPYRIAIVFSGVKRTLVGSAYNTRVDELKSASYSLKAFADMEYGSYRDSVLRDVPREVFEEYKGQLPKNFYKRALHYYDEMDRVSRAVKAWKNGDIEEFGRISFESGESSIVNYEAGSPELKAIHEILSHTEGVYGGRFSGAGFKGCCLAIVNPEFEESIKKKVTEEYLKLFPQYRDSFEVFFCETADGCDF
ncbi:MAG: GHMP kinase [Clostridia bacterium]|nr:GHMP kinase [Clostridia bacterium]